jgi:hypothetical protein
MEVLHSKKAQQENSEIRKWVRNTHTPRERERAVCFIYVCCLGVPHL